MPFQQTKLPLSIPNCGYKASRLDTRNKNIWRHSSAIKPQDNFTLPDVSTDNDIECQHTTTSNESTQEEMQAIISSHNDESVVYPGTTQIPTVDMSKVPANNPSINDTILANITMSNVNILTPHKTLMDGSTVYQITQTQDTNLPQATMIQPSLIPDTQIVANLDHSQIQTLSLPEQPTVDRDMVNYTHVKWIMITVL